MLLVDHWIASLLAPLAIWVLVNGIDDLFIACIAGLAWLTYRLARADDPLLQCPTDQQIDAVPERRMAIFVCLWREHRVIRHMIEHNTANIHYKNYDFFIGVYPNDTQTVAAATEACKGRANVHLSMTPHPGGTSKADNLNWIYQRMLLFEEEHGCHFDMIVLHDAEDLIHPDDLRWLNYYAQWYDQIQIPVLALGTKPWELTHGVYCDEFAEFQYKDMPARELLCGFLPSSGVGTGFSRRALEAVAAGHANQIFDATSLTEDYETGFRIHQQGLPQKFVPITWRNGQFIATREYFAQTLSKAIKQRSRWVTGIGLQSWEKHPPGEILAQVYWFWRDRKGVIGNLLTPLTNLIFLYGAITWGIARWMHLPWGMGAEPLPSWLAPAWWPLAIMGLQGAVRVMCSAGVYGWKFAALVPVRILWANVINFCATFKAVKDFVWCKIRGQPLRWIKTEHAYPTRAALLTETRRLGEILVASGAIAQTELDFALASQPAGMRIGEYLIALGKITEDQLYLALSLQQHLPLGKPNRDSISEEVTRTLPAEVVRSMKVLPFRIVAGELYVAGPEVPSEVVTSRIHEFCPLEIRFHLVKSTEFEEMANEYMPPRARAAAAGD